MALSAQRHIHILTSNHFLGVISSFPEREACTLLAQLANSCQLLDLLTLWQESQNIWEVSSQESTLKRGNNHHLSTICCLLTELNNISEELPLINTNDIELLPAVL